MKNDQSLSTYIIVSIALHLAMFFIIRFGLPSFFKPEPEEYVMTVEVVPVEAVSNIKTQKPQHDEKIVEDKAKKVQKSKVEETDVAPKDAKKPEPKKEIAPKKEEKKPDEKKEPIIVKEKKEEKKEEKKPEQKRELESKPEKTPEKKPKPKKKKTPTPSEMDALLKTLEKESSGKEERSRKRSVADKSDAIEEAIGKFNENNAISISEIHTIRQQIEDKWNVPIGVQNAGDLAISIYIALKPDGTVEQVKPSISCPSNLDLVCKAVVDSAIRAVWQASPFRNLSKERYESWKVFNLVYDLKDLLM